MYYQISTHFSAPLGHSPTPGKGEGDSPDMCLCNNAGMEHGRSAPVIALWLAEDGGSVPQFLPMSLVTPWWGMDGEQTCHLLGSAPGTAAAKLWQGC